MANTDSSLIALETLQWTLQLLIFFYAGLALVYAVQGWITEYRENRLAPVSVNLWDSIWRRINPFRWLDRSSWKECDAIIKQAYPVSRRFFKTLYSIPGMGKGLGIVHPFRHSTKYYPLIWYQYEIQGMKYWGKRRFPWGYGYGSSAEATAIGSAVLGKSITIRYNPRDPGDSLADLKQLGAGLKSPPYVPVRPMTLGVKLYLIAVVIVLFFLLSLLH